MDRDKLLRDIGLDLDTFQAHIRRMRKHGNLHKLDVDLLQEKTRKLYDSLFSLEETFDTVEKKESDKTINLPEKMPEAEIPEKVESKKDEPAGTIVQDKKPEEQQKKPAKAPEPKAVVEEPKAVPKKEPEVVEKVVEKKEPKPAPQPELVDVVKDQAPVSEPQKIDQQEEENKDEGSIRKSAFDLFSSSAGETIGDKLGEGDQASIADQMQKTTITDLKKAIGINEKFLFINELFGGDLGKYNKAIEEFNALPTKEGVSAHLLELKVQNQWDENSDAFYKLKALLERKFG